MREEIAAAVVFVTRFIKLNESRSISKEKVDGFSKALSAILVEKFRNHWYSEEPSKGQGYRCIRINPAEPIDPVLEKAATVCGLRYPDLNMPQELTLWVDPQEVCCRFGESQGSFCNLTVLKDGSLENQAHTINVADLLEQQQRRLNQNLNIVTTRTAASKLRAQAMKNASNFHFLQMKNSQQQNKYNQNYYNNQQQPGGGPMPPMNGRPFQNKPPFKSNSYPNFSGQGQQQGQNQQQQPPPQQQHKGQKGNMWGGNYVNTNYNVNGSQQGQQGSTFNPPFHNKDRFHWVRNKQQGAVEKMRLSPN